MIVTEIRIKLMDEDNNCLRAFCSIAFDRCLVIRDLRVIEGVKGLFVAMPSHKITDHCPQCHCRNHLRARFCNYCGEALDENRAPRDQSGRTKLYADIAHPINPAGREYLQEVVLEAYHRERKLAQQPGYVCRYDDYSQFVGEGSEEVLLPQKIA